MMDEIAEQKSLSGFGVRLKKARESLRLSQRDAAARLHLNVRVIQILENEDFENAPPATFMRGYMRSYARLLNIPEQEVDVAFEQIGLEQPQPTGAAITTPLLSIGEHQHNKWYMQWANYVLVSMLIVLVGVWWSTRTHYSIDKIGQVAMQQLPSASTVASQTQPTPAIAPATTNPATAAKPAVDTQQSPMPANAATTGQPTAPAQSATVTPTQPTAPTAPAANAATQAVTQPTPTTVVIAPAAPLQNPPKATHHRSRSDNMGMILQEPGLESDGNTVDNDSDY